MDRSQVPGNSPPSNGGPASAANPKQERAGYSDAHLSQLHDQLNREKKEPTEMAAPLPISVVLLCCIVVAWSAFYFGSHYNQFSPDVFDPNYNPLAANAPAPEYDIIKAGERLYAQNCVQCHQQDGNGVAGAFPPLAGSEWVAGDPERFAAILINGLVGPIEVKGNTYNGNMPAFGAALSDKKIAAVMTYVRQSWGNTEPPVAEEAVAGVRSQYGTRAPWDGPTLLDTYPLGQ